MEQILNDTGVATEDSGPVVLNTLNLLANDTDVDVGDTKSLTAVSVTSAAGATVSIDGQGYVVYDPGALFQSLKAGETTTDNFTYTMNDRAGAESSATVTMTITGLSDKTVLTSAVANEGVSTTVIEATNASAQDIAAISGTLEFSDADVGDTLTASITSTSVKLNGSDVPVGVTVPAALTVAGVLTFGGPVISNQGEQTIAWTYDPAQANLDFLAEGDLLTVTHAVRVADSDTWDIIITVQGTNDAPLPQNDGAFLAEEDTEITFGVNPLVAGSLLANDRDPDFGDAVKFVSVASTSAKGSTVGFDALSGMAFYTADSDQFDSLGNGVLTTDTFNYTVKDEHGAERSATVTVSIRGAADGVPINGTNNPDILTGTKANETIQGSNGNDALSGMAGSDRIMGGNGDDILRGGDGADRVWGDRGTDEIWGERGNDDLFGGTRRGRVRLRLARGEWG